MYSTKLCVLYATPTHAHHKAYVFERAMLLSQHNTQYTQPALRIRNILWRLVRMQHAKMRIDHTENKLYIQVKGYPQSIGR